MPGQSLTDLYVELSAKGLDVVEADLALVQRNAVFAGQAFANLAATSAKGLGDMENRPRLVAAAMKVLSGETQNLGEALARMQGGGGGGGQSGGFAGGAAVQPGGPSGGGGGTTGGSSGLAKPASDLDSGMIAAAVAQLHNFTLATVAAETKTAALMYAMQSPALKGYASVLARASVVQAEFDASINLEKLKIQNESAAKYGQALAAAGKEQEKFTAAVRFEQISAQSGRFAASLDALKGKMAQLGQATSSAFGGATSMITSFARAGLSGTTMGERLGLQFQLLSREIASLFIPVLERVIGVLQSVTSWFRNLSGPQQSFIGGIAATAIALVAVAAIIPRIIGGLQGMAAVFTLLSANPFVALVGLIAALLVGTESGRSALGRLAAAFGPIVTAVGQLFAALKPVIELLGTVVGAVADFIGGIASGIANGIQSVTDFFGLTSEEDRRRSAQQEAQRRQQAGRDRNEVAGTTKGREGLEATFLRFQEAALKTGQGDTAMRQLTEAQRQTALLRQMTGNMSEPAPPAIG